ncbi:MAG: stage V sporulation protein G [Mariniblastus sp.]|jgi:stage V sporulation protein G
MEITEVRIKLIDNTEDRLRGFCSITFDNCFVVRDLKIIEGNNGPFVAMPSRKLTSNCFKCRTKNHLRASYCNNCGSKLRNDHIEHDQGGRAKLYADIAHPVNAACREQIQNRVIAELNQELELAAKPGYSSRYDEVYNEETVAQAAADPRSVTAPEPPTDKSKSRETRLDSAPATRPAPHKSSQDVSSGRSKPAMEEFGKGIFD